MIKVGLTGNIGSGKSTVARIFNILGVPVLHADEEAKKILDNPAVRTLLKDTFGPSILSGDAINRKELSQLVFNDKNALQQLNAIIHPRVRHQLNEWFDKQSLLPMAIEEAAIIFESGIHQNFDKIITVSCPESLAIQRVMKRDGSREQDVLSRMAHQWTQKRKEELSDFVIVNDENRLLIPQVIEIHKKICMEGKR